MIRYLTLEQVVELHDELVRRFGGLSGIRDKGLLHSSLEAPKAAFGGEDMYPTVSEKAAAYLFHIVKNHPFNDGNKRTAFVVVFSFMIANEAEIKFSAEDLEAVVVAVSAGEISKSDTQQFLENGRLLLE